MKRRDFLRASAAGGAAAVGASVWTRRANAVPFGEIPSDKESSMLPANLRAESILECFLYGGLIPWETFYCIPGRGEADQTWAYTNYAHMIKAAEGCGYTGDVFKPWKTDSQGQQIYFGPYMQRLWDRPDVMSRMRIVINRHSLSPHEAAIPLVATGRTLGNPALAGLSTHINRYFVDRDPNNLHPTPFAVGMATGSNFIPNDNVLSYFAQGVHPGNARPLMVKVDQVTRLRTLLARGVVGVDNRKTYDKLLQVYFDDYQNRLKQGGAADVVRAKKFQELLQASVTQSKVDLIDELLRSNKADLFAPMGSNLLENASMEYSTSCKQVTGQTAEVPGFAANAPQVGAAGNIPAMSLRLAAHLLTHPNYPVRHATVVDVGVQQADGGGGYDTHSNGPWRQASNWDNFLKCLLERINTPGENDPDKISLDKTMVILNSEFGRAPGRQNAGGLGRNHWPLGFAQIYIGGPIGPEQSGYYGHIDESAVATTFTTPAENRIAALLALGIYPFDPAAYSGSDAQGETQEGPAARSIIKRVLGHTV
jgi:Protein of unknown function (DUF1501)